MRCSNFIAGTFPTLPVARKFSISARAADFFCVRSRKMESLGSVLKATPNRSPPAKSLALSISRSTFFKFGGGGERRAIPRQCDGVYCCHLLEHLEPAQLFEL